jgi:hypothetical protein
MTKPQPTIDTILEQFFARQLAGRKGITLRRIEEVEENLRACLESEAHRILVTSDLLLLAAEREFDPTGAVGRVMHADDLIFVLSIFVQQEWMPLDPVQRRAQLRLVDALTGSLLGARLVNRDELCCPLLDIRAGIDRGRAELRRPRGIAQARLGVREQERL